MEREKQSMPSLNTDVVAQSPTVKCPKCGNIFFTEKIVLKKISKLVSPTGNDETLPINVWVCDKCGEIPKEIDVNGTLKKLVYGESKENIIL